MVKGHCSACGQPAEQAPSGSWWHLRLPCAQRSVMLFQPVKWYPDGSMGPTGPEESGGMVSPAPGVVIM